MELRCAPGVYARVLLSVVELVHRSRPLFASCGMSPAEVTTRRIERLLLPRYVFHRRMPFYYWAVILLVAAVVLPGDSSFALDLRQGNVNAPRQTQADQAFAAQDWEKAAELYAALVEENAEDGRSWFRLGYSLHADGKLDEAIEAHQRASEFAQIKAVSLYNLACALSLQNRVPESLRALEKSLQAGFWSQQPLKDDPDLVNVLDHEKFASLAERARPPAEREVYRQFDFWVGSWEVVNRNGQVIGTNVISKDEHGFLITEKWTSANGGTGTSINYYDPSEQKWKQTWVSGDGTIVKYAGTFSDGKMQLVGERIFASGQKGLSRVSFTPLPGNQVRQFIEHSRDNGATWSTYFDGTYRRRDSETPNEA